MPLDAQPLLVLLKAGKPDIIDGVLLDTFRYRKDGLSGQKSTQWQGTLGVTPREAKSLFASVEQLIRTCLYSNLDQATIPTVFPKGFHPQLIKLLGKIIVRRLPEWKEAVMADLVGPPKLVDFDWRVDMKTSSNCLSRMKVPTVFVAMQLQESPQEKGVLPPMKEVQLELSKQALGTMLEGLGKIRDQLGAIK
mmetsp:Transcript_23915/g.26546  ORF Transcript_23915/g.26546 Transcript_23915/m.26546 type:complete len:193 (+) Transcript_23915:27-605(+)|eukprot:CAMPEP_0205832066 /NCGR_PEP_ID=MMETSP0206-20130828/45954_1 /ASSEMBLY_ACC=CAM_ASM_000279 /TAXON_ID=36767 /ORGANISM="Euplotes focardii, Strain TN1" /LENGTH=192 /DNA_ID=CAMNT_0053137275 /DNA_START=18 /DNA_END=596 /DNA_ORIENTATION=-